MEHKIDLENEVWKVWKDTRHNHGGSEGHLYEVSDQGRAKVDGKLFDFTYQGDKYYGFGRDYLHRIIAKLFIPNPDNKPCVDHINSDIHDNRVCNLRWVTAKENVNNPITKSKRKNLVWIYLNDQKKMIPLYNLNYWLNNGWNIGRISSGAKGRRWVHLGDERKLVTLYEFECLINEGWCEGSGKNNNMSLAQKGNTNTKDHIYIHLDNKQTCVHKDKLDEYLDNGWELGKLKKNKSVN